MFHLPSVLWADPVGLVNPTLGVVQARLARPAPAASRIWRGPPGHEYSGKTQQYQRERNRTPPVLPEGSKTMVALTPNPEDAEKQENGADNLANPTHSLKTIPADVLARVAADTGGRQVGCRSGEPRQHVHARRGPIAPEALHFLETKSGVKVKGGDIIRPGHVERLVGAGEDPVQPGPRQRRGDTPAPPRRFHKNAAEVTASRSSWARLIRCQLGHPAVGDYLAVRLGHEHLAQVSSDVGCELLATVTGINPKDTCDKLDGRCDVPHR